MPQGPAFHTRNADLQKIKNGHGLRWRTDCIAEISKIVLSIHQKHSRIKVLASLCHYKSI